MRDLSNTFLDADDVGESQTRRNERKRILRSDKQQEKHTHTCPTNGMKTNWPEQLLGRFDDLVFLVALNAASLWNGIPPVDVSLSKPRLLGSIYCRFLEIYADFDPFQKHHCLFHFEAKLFSKFRCRHCVAGVFPTRQKIGNFVGFLFCIKFVRFNDTIKLLFMQCVLIGLEGVVTSLLVFFPVSPLVFNAAVPLYFAAMTTTATTIWGRFREVL